LVESFQSYDEVVIEVFMSAVDSVVTTNFIGKVDSNFTGVLIRP
jgi:hypothetical protein